MRNKARLTAFLAAVMILAMSMLTSCGGSAPEAAETAGTQTDDVSSLLTKENARNFVKAVLDITCTGDYDHNVPMTDIEEGTEAQAKEAAISAYMDAALGEKGLSEETQQKFHDALSAAFSSCKYTVGEATATEDGGFDVAVTVEPLKMLKGCEDKIEETLLAANEEGDISTRSEEEVNDAIYAAMAEVIQSNAENPSYDEPVEFTVHYGINDTENNNVGLSDEDSEKLGLYLFSDDAA